MRSFNEGQYPKPGKTSLSYFSDNNVYLPRRALINNIIEENALVKTFEIVLEDEIYNTDFTYLPGQFMMLSIPHCGEAPFSFSSSPSRPSTFSLSIRKIGKLTTAVHALKAGDMVGVRGPYGQPFPMDDLAGNNLVFVAGGIGMAPLRSVIEFCVDNHDEYGDITVLYGCKNSGEICFEQDLNGWVKSGLITTRFTVDEPCDQWNGCTGLVTALLDDISIRGTRNKALVCGPGVMIRFVVERLMIMGLQGEDIITTLERNMKCGIGICGHCHHESKLICTDGPVFYVSELTDLVNL